MMAASQSSTLTWTPPSHFEPSKSSTRQAVESFDQQELADNDKELWLIRIPDNLNAADLDGVTLDLSCQNTLINETAYRVALDTDASDAMTGGEMRAMHCLVPKHNNVDGGAGKLVLAPMPFAQRITLTREVSIPSSKPLAEQIQAQTIKKRVHPNHLKVQFPFTSVINAADSVMSESTIVAEEEASEISTMTVDTPQKLKKRKHNTPETPTSEKKKKKKKKEKKEKRHKE